MTDVSEREYSYEFLGRRGVTPETFRYFGCPTKVDREGRPTSIGFHYPNGSVKVRLLDKKEFFWVGKNEPGLFGKNLFPPGSNKFVTITEGELDALSLFQVLHTPVVSVQSASTASRDATVDRSWLNSFERIYLAFDDDEPGRDARRAVARLFEPSKVYVVEFGDRKDANAFLQEGLTDELLTLWNNSRKYLPANVISHLKDFDKIVSEEPEWGVPYPFHVLNDMTYGIRRGEIVLVTAQEGVGKTEFMRTLEHKLLKETEDNVGAFYLEEPPKRHLQSLAGIELRKPAHLPDSGCKSSEVSEALHNLIKKDDRLFLYSHFGSDDPEVLLDTIRYLVTACNVYWIIVDHLTMVVSGLHAEDERRTLDYICTQLATLVTSLNFALLIVSHVNDDMKTRGSRYAGKVAHIRIDLMRDLLNVDPVVRNTTKIIVPKNRYSGRTGPAGDIVYNALTNSYSEFANAA